MQPLTDADRATLTAAHVTVDFGCDIVDDFGAVVDDLTPDLVGGEVQHNGFADVHRTATLHTTRMLDWSSVWLRPWQSITGAGHTARFDLGVFRPAIPETPLGVFPLVFEVTCADRLSLLQRIIGDTVVSPKGASALNEAVRALAASQVPGRALLDPAAVVLPSAMVWVLVPSSATTYLQWTNDILAAAGYDPVYMSPDGDYRASLHMPLSARPAEWRFDVADLRTSIVGVDRSSTTTSWNPVNWWRFIRTGMPAAPSEGDGIYTVDRSGGGVQTRSITALDAVSQDALKVQGDAAVAQDTTMMQTIEIEAGPLPCLTHRDVVDYIDPQLGGTALHCQVQSWSLDLATGQTHIVLEVPRG